MHTVTWRAGVTLKVSKVDIRAGVCQKLMASQEKMSTQENVTSVTSDSPKVHTKTDLRGKIVQQCR